jgi:hypothetical protein
MFGLNKELVILGLIGFGVFAQHSEVCLANNTTILLIILALFLGQTEIDEIKRELCCVENFTRTTGCRCAVRNRLF